MLHSTDPLRNHKELWAWFSSWFYFSIAAPIPIETFAIFWQTFHPILRIRNAFYQNGKRLQLKIFSVLVWVDQFEVTDYWLILKDFHMILFLMDHWHILAVEVLNSPGLFLRQSGGPDMYFSCYVRRWTVDKEHGQLI